MANRDNILNVKLERFYKKYFINEFLKGIVFFIGLLIFSVAFLIFLEGISYIPPNGKLILLIVFSITHLLAFIVFIIRPLLKYFKIFPGLNINQTNQIITNHFPEVKDQLINAIELKNTVNDDYSKELLAASIDQKINSLGVFNFNEAVSYKRSIIYLAYLTGTLILAVIITVLFSDTIKNPIKRLLNYDVTYSKPSPYNYKILNDSLKIGNGDDLFLRAEIFGKKELGDVYISFGGNDYLMRSDSTDFYSFDFESINNDFQFFFKNDGYQSKNFNVDVLHKPVITNFSIHVDKPNYTRLKDEKFENLSEIVVPNGTKCQFNLSTDFVDSLDVLINNKDTLTVNNNDGNFLFERSFTQSSVLKISIYNEFFKVKDYLYLKVEVISDEYPVININEVKDSIDFTYYYFNGLISDDYGFTNLFFHIKFNENDSIKRVQFLPTLNEQEFYYAFDFKSLKKYASSFEYYFEVFDNDYITGPKSSISDVGYFNFPDETEMIQEQEKAYEDIENLINETMEINNQLKKDMFNLQEKMINSELTDWEQKQYMNNILSKKENLQNTINSLKEKQKEINNYMESFSDQNQELLEKQKQIEELVENLFTDELKELLDEFNKMLSDFKKDNFEQLKKKTDISLDDLSEQLDKNLEMLKKMQIEQQMDMMKNKLDQLKENQQNYQNELENGTKKPNELTEDLNNDAKDFEKLKDQYEKIKEKNKELENKLDLMDFEKEEEEISKEFQKSQKSSQENSKKDTKQSLEKNEENLSDLSSMMQQMMDSNFMQQKMENLDNLISLLDNFITFSFDQEEAIKIPDNEDFRIKILRNQKKLEDNFVVIKDSLYALAKREPAINTVVNKEIVSIESNFELIDEHLDENKINAAKIKQQYILTSANNLALFLSEVIDQLQKQMSSSSGGNNNCNKPGGKSQKPSLGSMKQMQQGLQQQLQSIMKQMKQGQNPSQMNQQLGKALSQQEMMQQMLRDMMNSGEVGSGAFETLKDADELLNKIRTDILRNNVSQQTLNRQKQIMTRLLEAENAENEREIDNKRKSQTAEEQYISNPAKYFEKSGTIDKFEERLLKNKLLLNKYYQKKYSKYINQLDSLNGEGNKNIIQNQ